MGDSDHEIDVPHLRKGLKRVTTKLKKHYDRFVKTLGEDSPATIDFYALEAALKSVESLQKEYNQKSEEMEGEETDEALATEDEKADDVFEELLIATWFTIKLLLSKRAIHRAMIALGTVVESLEEAFMAEPAGDHSDALAAIKDKSAKLSTETETTSLKDEDPLMMQATAVVKKSFLIKAKVTKSTTPDVKHPIPAVLGKSTFKVDPVTVPTFSGRTEDWLPFWRLFKKAIHDKADLDDDIRLTYLLKSMKDPVMRNSYSERVDDVGAYTAIVAELQAEFDRPRWMHRRYCESMRTLTTNPHTRAGMKEVVNKVTTILKGFIRLKGESCHEILTSITESVMDKELRCLWNQRTDKLKKTPPIEDLLSFIKDQADQMDQVEGKQEPFPSSKQQPEKNKFKSAKHRQRGSTNATTSSSGPAPSPSAASKAQSPRTAPRYGCPLCPDQHYPYQCSIFNQYSLSQRKKHARDHNLCTLCLKPWHTAANCNSTFKCRFCKGSHNSLLHEVSTSTGQGNNSTSPTAPATQSVALSTTAVAQAPEKDHLMMTSQVIITGPTGISMIARALLDSASTLSILSSKAKKTLSLKKSEHTAFIKGVGASAYSTTPCPMVKVKLSSEFQKDWNKEITVAVMDRVTEDLPLQGAHSARRLPHLQDLHLADRNFHKPGTIDLLLGQDVFGDVLLKEDRRGPPGTPMAWLTVFGWTVMGPYTPDSPATKQPAITNVAASTGDLTTNELLAKMWVLEEPQEEDRIFTQEEQQVEEHFAATHTYDKKERRYTVRLPKKNSTLQLGDSRGQALNRAKDNERSLLRKDCWPQFQAVIQEYLDLGHATLINPEDLHQSPSTNYYMPIHAVFKQSSSSTKLRAVFDASAKTTSQVSLNELLAVGPTLQPALDQTLLRFRTYSVALSGDISKMYREVLLHPEDRCLHRFIWRPGVDQPWQDYEMRRVTFGVTASPYLAVKTLLQAAKDFSSSLPEAKLHLEQSFYVDDFLGGADSPEAALSLYNDLRTVLSQAGFQLKKWRSSSADVLASIPEDLQEPLPQQELVDLHAASYPRALGIAWDSREDTMATHVSLPPNYVSTKRGVITDIAKTFDVLGWLAPAILPMKLLYRQLWELQVDWDEEVPGMLKERHKQWREELPLLAKVKLPRHYFSQQKPLTVELHAFCDASQEAYAATIYIKATYSSRPPTSLLVTSKTRVAPLKPRTIPRLELCGAHLLARLLNTTRQTLNVPLRDCFAYSDSTIVLAWLNGSPQRYKVFVANRINNTICLLPASSWKHVPTLENPADCASRGLTARELMSHTLWWHGPPWLLKQPFKPPPQPTAANLRPNLCCVMSSQHYQWKSLKPGSAPTSPLSDQWLGSGDWCPWPRRK